MEIDVRDGYRTVADVDAMIQQLATVVARVPEPERVVIIADWRNCAVLTPAVSERAVAMMTGANARLLRAAIVHAPAHPTSILQLFRLVKESQTEHRRVFTDAAQASEWLAPLLSADEQRRLQTFLAQRQ